MCWTLVKNDQEDFIQDCHNRSKGVPRTVNTAKTVGGFSAPGLGEGSLMGGRAFLLNWPPGILTAGRPRLGCQGSGAGAGLT